MNEDIMMDLTQNMEIGDLNFCIRGKISNMLQKPEPAYRSFLEEVSTHSGHRHMDIEIILEFGGIPDTKNLTKSF